MPTKKSKASRLEILAPPTRHVRVPVVSTGLRRHFGERQTEEFHAQQSFVQRQRVPLRHRAQPEWQV